MAAASDNTIVPIKDMETIVRSLVGSNDIHVTDVKFKSATSEVSGFMALHSRAVVTTIHQGKEKQFTFFIKSSPKQQSQKEFVNQFNVFDIEIGFYTQIIAQITELGITLPYAKCYLARSGDANDFLVMEDLAQSGYILADRKKGLDFAHCSLVMQQLAKLHAGSVALEQKKGRPLNQVFPFLKDLLFNPEPPEGNEFINKFLETVLVLAKRFLPHLKDSIPSYESRIPTLLLECRKLVELWSVVNVTLHGDLWINNLLFAYKDTNPISVKLLDLQVASYHAPTIDMIVFLWASTVRAFRKENEKALIKIYYDSFLNTLGILNTKTPEGLTFETLWEHYLSISLVGAVFKIIYLPFVLMDSEDMANLVDPDKPDGFGSYLKDDQTRNTCNHFQRNENFRVRMTEAIEELFEAMKL